MKFLRKINLEINKDLYNPIQVKQGDNSRYLLFNLLDNGVPFSLENKTVRVYGLKPDGTKVFNNLTIINAARGLAELQLTTQMLVKPGCLKLELVIYEATDILSTTKFDIDVIASLRDDAAIESTNEFSALTLGLSKLDEWDKYFKETSGAIEEKYTERLNGIASSLEKNTKYLNDITINAMCPPIGFNLTPCKIDGVTDDKVALQGLFDFLKQIGGGTLLIPKYSNNDMLVSGKVTLNCSDVTLDIRSNIRLTSTKKDSLLCIVGGGISNKIKNIKIISNGCRLDGNGSNIQGYEYSLSDNNYQTLYCWMVENLFVDNIQCDNGLVGSCTISGCKNYVIQNSKFTNAVHDNGFQSVSNPLGNDNYNPSDVNSYTSGRIINCEAYGNTDLGFTSWQSPYVSFEDCVSHHNGNKGTSFNSGGGFSAEVGTLTPRYDMYVKFKNCKAYDNIGYGFYCDMDGVEYDNVEASRTIHNTLSDTITRYGNGITIIGSRKNIKISGKFYDNEKNGIKYISIQGDENAISSLTLNVECYNNGVNGIQLQGISYSEGSIKTFNNKEHGLRIDNIENYNLNNGKVIFKNINSYLNGLTGFIISGVKEVFIDDIYLLKNREFSTSGNNATVYNSDYVSLNNIRTFKGDSTKVSMGLQIYNTNKSKIFNVTGDFGNALNLQDTSIEKIGLYKGSISDLSPNDTLSTSITKINTILDRLRNARIING